MVDFLTKLAWWRHFGSTLKIEVCAWRGNASRFTDQTFDAWLY
jgi:hypothetical protein